jgi:hypothetical protein
VFAERGDRAAPTQETRRKWYAPRDEWTSADGGEGHDRTKGEKGEPNDRLASAEY